MLKNLIDKISAGISLPEDSPADRIRKVTFVGVSLFYTLSSIMSIFTSIGFKQTLGNAVAITGIVIYSVATVVGVLLVWYLFATRRFVSFVNLSLLNIALAHLTTRVLLGGYYSGSMMWFLLVPFSAAILLNRRNMIFWVGFYLVMEIFFAAIDPYLAEKFSANQLVPPVIMFLVGAIPVITFLVVAFRYFVNEIDRVRAQADELLLNILPEPIAEKLKTEPGVIAEGHQDVTILFADIVNFTTLSASADPVDVVNMLNTVFTAFDDLAEKHGLEKIKTIGDAYMVAGGLPTPQEDHCQAVAKFSLEMLETVNAIKAFNGQPVRLRVGINTGPVVAGVIGRHKFIYDLWGDAVNTASRMESNGLENVVQVTQAVKDKLDGQFNFKAREPIMVKGKGEMATYILSAL